MDGMEKIRMRCHISIIFESLWQFWAVILLMLVNQIDNIVDIINEFGAAGLKGLIASGGIWGLVAVLGLTLLVLMIQFFRWRKTWITLDENLIIIERNTLKKVKNTIAIENISAVNMERNLFERIIGTYRIKMDTNSSTTANKTDISIVFSYKKAVAFRNAVMQKMHELKGITLQDSSVENSVTREKAEQDPWTADENLEGKTVYRYSPKDMALHCLYSASIFSLLVTIAGIVGFIIYVNIFSIQSFMQNVLGGAIALILLVLGSAYSLIKKFITYYDFRVYRDEKELHLRYGLIKLRSYTIPVDKITCLEIQQPVFSRIWKRYQAKVITVGVGDEEGESSNLTMALPKDMFLKQLADLLPEYGDDTILDNIKKQKKEALILKGAKFVKWTLILTAIDALVMYYSTLPWIYAVLSGVGLLLFIGAMYLLSHMTAGYRLGEEKIVLAQGIFMKRIYICNYNKMQNIKLSAHPLSRPFHMVTGVVYLLNTAVGIPYVEKEIADEISERMIH